MGLVHRVMVDLHRMDRLHQIGRVADDVDLIAHVQIAVGQVDRGDAQV